MARPITSKLVVVSLLSIAGACSAHAQSDSEVRSVSPFSRLSVQDGIDVHLTQSDEQSLRIEVDGYDLGDIVAEVDGDELRLSNRGRQAFAFFEGRHASVYLDFVELTAIDASAGSDIRGRNDLELDELSVEVSGGSDVDLTVQAQSLEFALSGGSDLRLSGTTQSLAIDASGGSDVSAESLEAERASITASGGSDVNVRATASIAVDAGGGSDVSIYGNPAERTIDVARSSDVTWR